MARPFAGKFSFILVAKEFKKMDKRSNSVISPQKSFENKRLKVSISPKKSGQEDNVAPMSINDRIENELKGLVFDDDDFFEQVRFLREM